MISLLGYIACGIIMGAATLIGGRLSAQRAAINIGIGLIGTLLVALLPEMTSPEPHVRGLLLDNGAVAASFFVALVAVWIYGSLQVLAPVTPEEHRGAMGRWADGAVLLAGAMVIVGLATAKLALAA